MMKPAVDCFIASTTQASPLMRFVCCAANATAVALLAPFGNPMSSGMFLKGDDFKILNSVVLLVAVLMMNALARCEFPSEVNLHDMPVFFDAGAVQETKLNIPARTNPSAPIKACCTLSGTMCGTAGDTAILRGPVLELIRCAGKRLAALGTLAARMNSRLPLSATANRACDSPGGLRIHNLEVLTADWAGKCFHTRIIPNNTTLSTARTYTLVTETT